MKYLVDCVLKTKDGVVVVGGDFFSPPARVSLFTCSGKAKPAAKKRGKLFFLASFTTLVRYESLTPKATTSNLFQPSPFSLPFHMYSQFPPTTVAFSTL